MMLTLTFRSAVAAGFAVLFAAVSPALAQLPPPSQLPRLAHSTYRQDLAELKRLRDQGVLTPDRFEAAHLQLLKTCLFSPRELDQVPRVIDHGQTGSLQGLGDLPTYIVVDYVVGPTGAVTRIQPVFGSITPAATLFLQNLALWRFTPGIKDGVPVATLLRTSFSVR